MNVKKIDSMRVLNFIYSSKNMSISEVQDLCRGLKNTWKLPKSTLMSAKKKKKQFQSIYNEDEAVTSPGIDLHAHAEPPKLVPLPDPSERRKDPRYAVEFETVVFCKGQSFRTKTINVSLSGALLQDSIPAEFVDQVIDIVMIRNVGRNRDYFLVKGKALGSPFRSPRIQFTTVADAQKQKLEALFEACPPVKG